MLGLPAQETILFFPADPRRSFNKGFDLLQAGLNLLKSSARLITGGAIAHDQMPLYLNAADLVIQTSRYEASPMIVKEAMACQRPLVSTDVGDVREVFGRTPGYWLCAPTPEDIARKMEAALRFDQPLRGRERILELGLSLEQVAEKYLSRYTQLIHQERIYAHSSS
jgi:glycosyltransferase involved in cell wall biosynthesis